MATPLNVIKQILVYDARGYDTDVTHEIKPASVSDNNLFPRYLSAINETLNLDEADVLRLTIKRGCPWHIENVIQKNSRILIVYESTGKRQISRLYRVRNVSTGTGSGSEYKIEAWSIDVDLTTRAWGWKTEGSSEEYFRMFDFAGFTVEDVLREIFSALPSAWKISDISSDISSLEISPLIRNNTVAEAIAIVREALQEDHDKTLEYELDYNRSLNQINVSFVPERGWTDAEYANGEPDPSLRVIAAPFINLDPTNPDRGSRVFTKVQNVQDDYVSQLIPRAGQEENEEIGTGGIQWQVIRTLSQTENGKEFTYFSLEAGAVTFDDQLNDAEDSVYYVKDDNGDSHEIMGSSGTDNTIKIAGTHTTEYVIFMEVYSPASSNPNQSNSRNLDYVRRPDAENVQGVVQKVQEFPSVVPYDNLFESATPAGSGDMSEWFADPNDPDAPNFLANGAPIGSAEIRENSDREWITVGKRSAKVSADKEEGIAFSFTIADDEMNPYVSANVVLQVEKGRVRMVLVDSDGGTFPLAHEQQHEGLPGITAALQSQGWEPKAGEATCRILAKEDDTVFYVDTVSITQSPTAWPYAPHMGKKDLWKAASTWMVNNGGRRPLTTSLQYVNLDLVGERLATPIEVGSWVRIKDLRDPATGTKFNLQLDGRVEKIENDGNALWGGITRRATIGRQRESVISQLENALPERPKPIVFPPTPLPLPEVDGVDFGNGIVTWQEPSGANALILLGFLRYTPPEGSEARVTRFRVVTASGASLPKPGTSKEVWTEVTRTSGYYQTSVQIANTGLSWIRYEIQIDNGTSSSVIGEVSFDSDRIPQVSNVWLDYLPSTKQVAVNWVADEDVGGTAYVWKKLDKFGASISKSDWESSITNSRFANGNGIQRVLVSADIAPGDYFVVWLLPFKDALTTSTDYDDVIKGQVATEGLRIPLREDLPIYKVDHSKSGENVNVWLDVQKPGPFFSKVQVRQARGRPIATGDAYADKNPDTGSATPGQNYRGRYTETVLKVAELKQRLSYVQFRIVTIEGVDDIDLAPVVIDTDNIPDARIIWNQTYNATAETWEIQVFWAGDDDFKSVSMELTVGTDKSTYSSNNTQGNVIVSNSLRDTSNDLIKIGNDQPWTLKITGWTGNYDGSPRTHKGNSTVIETISGKTPPLSWDKDHGFIDGEGIRLKGGQRAIPSIAAIMDENAQTTDAKSVRFYDEGDLDDARILMETIKYTDSQNTVHKGARLFFRGDANQYFNIVGLERNLYLGKGNNYRIKIGDRSDAETVEINGSLGVYDDLNIRGTTDGVKQDPGGLTIWGSPDGTVAPVIRLNPKRIVDPDDGSVSYDLSSSDPGYIRSWEDVVNRKRVYEQVKSIIVAAANVNVADSDTAQTVTISATASGATDSNPNVPNITTTTAGLYFLERTGSGYQWSKYTKPALSGVLYTPATGHVIWFGPTSLNSYGGIYVDSAQIVIGSKGYGAAEGTFRNLIQFKAGENKITIPSGITLEVNSINLNGTTRTSWPAAGTTDSNPNVPNISTTTAGLYFLERTTSGYQWSRYIAPTITRYTAGSYIGITGNSIALDIGALWTEVRRWFYGPGLTESGSTTNRTNSFRISGGSNYDDTAVRNLISTNARDITTNAGNIRANTQTLDAHGPRLTAVEGKANTNETSIDDIKKKGLIILPAA